MIKEVNYADYAQQAIEILSKGAFLNTTDGTTDNTMTIAWGSIGFIWGKPIFMVMVRPSRYSFNNIESQEDFTVSIPLTDMSNALKICGSKSGRDINKFEAASLELMPGQKVKTKAIKNCGLHFECKIMCKQAMDTTHLNPEILNHKYASGDLHTLYYGEILSCYIEK